MPPGCAAWPKPLCPNPGLLKGFGFCPKAFVCPNPDAAPGADGFPKAEPVPMVLVCPNALPAPGIDGWLNPEVPKAGFPKALPLLPNAEG